VPFGSAQKWPGTCVIEQQRFHAVGGRPKSEPMYPAQSPSEWQALVIAMPDEEALPGHEAEHIDSPPCDDEVKEIETQQSGVLGEQSSGPSQRAGKPPSAQPLDGVQVPWTPPSTAT
jgi:hypothetical protein